MKRRLVAVMVLLMFAVGCTSSPVRFNNFNNPPLKRHVELNEFTEGLLEKEGDMVLEFHKNAHRNQTILLYLIYGFTFYAIISLLTD